MRIKARAKVNLTLKVSKRGSNNYHKIKSLMTIVTNFYDVLKIKQATTTFDEVICKISELEKDNFIYLVLNILREAGEISGYYKVFLKKTIPLGSGLGGGTSDAVALYLKLVKNRTPELDEKIAQAIGYDAYFFLSGHQTALVEGYGEFVTKQEVVKFKKRQLILTGIKCDTKKVYETFDTLPHNKAEKNHLTAAAIYLYPELEKFSKKGIMSGSGSTFFKTKNYID